MILFILGGDQVKINVTFLVYLADIYSTDNPAILNIGRRNYDEYQRMR